VNDTDPNGHGFWSDRINSAKKAWRNSRIKKLWDAGKAKVKTAYDSGKATFDRVKKDIGARVNKVKKGVGARVNKLKKDVGARVDKLKKDVQSRIKAAGAQLGAVAKGIGQGLIKGAETVLTPLIEATGSVACGAETGGESGAIATGNGGAPSGQYEPPVTTMPDAPEALSSAPYPYKYQKPPPQWVLDNFSEPDTADKWLDGIGCAGTVAMYGGVLLTAVGAGSVGVPLVKYWATANYGSTFLQGAKAAWAFEEGRAKPGDLAKPILSAATSSFVGLGVDLYIADCYENSRQGKWPEEAQ
jgi:hypothetical protein